MPACETGTASLRVAYEKPGQKPHFCKDEGGPTPRPLQRYEGETLVAITIKTALTCGFESMTALAGSTGQLQTRIAEEAYKAAEKVRSEASAPREKHGTGVAPGRMLKEDGTVDAADASFGIPATSVAWLAYDLAQDEEATKAAHGFEVFTVTDGILSMVAHVLGPTCKRTPPCSSLVTSPVSHPPTFSMPARRFATVRRSA